MGQSWSGIKKRLEKDLLCEKLRGRVKYFITKYRKAHDEESRIAILIDEKEVIRGNVFDSYREGNPLLDTIRAEQKIPKRLWNGKETLYENENKELEKRVDEICVDKGIIDAYLFAKALDCYLHHSIKESINSKNPLVRLFAILDRRIGKKTLYKLKDEVSKQPEWLRPFYMLRLDVENINIEGQDDL
ncbi:SF0329 family protein [Wukongibacter sp. M2B1]|uniref:SF0329 family protein n=1 Tax=Wukongibacter sp. M2B1 TaxID=3088895 RepID=UPI003D794B0D